MSLRDYMNDNPHARRIGCSICGHPQRSEIQAAIDEWLDLTPTERRNFGLRRLGRYIGSEVLDKPEGSWPSRQTLERHRDDCMEVDP